MLAMILMTQKPTLVPWGDARLMDGILMVLANLKMAEAIFAQ